MTKLQEAKIKYTTAYTNYTTKKAEATQAEQELDVACSELLAILNTLIKVDEITADKL